MEAGLNYFLFNQQPFLKISGHPFAAYAVNNKQHCLGHGSLRSNVCGIRKRRLLSSVSVSAGCIGGGDVSPPHFVLQQDHAKRCAFLALFLPPGGTDTNKLYHDVLRNSARELLGSVVLRLTLHCSNLRRALLKSSSDTRENSRGCSGTAIRPYLHGIY